jgi:hypothetical protein
MKVVGVGLVCNGRAVAVADGGVLHLGQPVAPVTLSRRDVALLIPFLENWVRAGHFAPEPRAGGYSVVDGDRTFGPFERREAAEMIVVEQGAQLLHEGRLIAAYRGGCWEATIGGCP